ncbi:hypothetical protein DDB_G0276695 [Dictyostelium discoideum AX4]|uniref:RCC1-like domain-containing protein n=1 Tax=Dictyostelium discoideum TaxID=44689 RepID=Q550Z9_DICDI|nr:hypothetical protein DDB_G0276695 [Dictyostelium discoideum AX4]EAL69105.1 hypothetical protein DDB_G0276695 [Dictyostelium discoideum AX4]|eukprot:XP_643039.1 hypothetical protein DDB_G0276695 [Dictyostelium discoideum AX4]
MISSVANWLSCGSSVVDKWIFGEGEDEDTTSSSGESNSDYNSEEEEEEEEEEKQQDEDSSSEEGEINEKKKSSSSSSSNLISNNNNRINKDNDNDGGLVYAWGYNYFGQCGDKTNQTIKVPTSILFPTIDNKIIIKQIACGDSHSLAIAEQPYGVYSWGVNRWGQLGHGDQLNRNQPTLLSNIGSGSGSGNSISFSMVACGSQHSMIVSNYGELYTFGCGTTGRLGHGDEQPKFKPTPVSSLVGKSIVSVAAGVMHSSCVDSNGKIYSWGWNRYGQLGNGSVKSQTLPTPPKFQNPKLSDIQQQQQQHHLMKLNFIKVVCGKNHTLALSSSGEVVGFGFNACGQLGNGNHMDQLYPVKIEFNEHVIDIASGYYHSLCLTDNGEAYSWGYMSDGSLGLGEVYTHQTKPKLIPLVHIRHCFTDSNDAFNEIYGRQDENTTQETIDQHKLYLSKKYSVGDTVDMISAGAWNSAIITSSGKLFCFGFGDTYRNGNQSEFDQDMPIIVEPTKWGLERPFNIKEDTDIPLNCIIEQEKERRLLKLRKKQLKEQKEKERKDKEEINLTTSNFENNLIINEEIQNNNNSNNNNIDSTNLNNINNINNNINNNNESPNIITNKINLNNIKVYSRVTNISLGGAHVIITVKNKLKK